MIKEITEQLDYYQKEIKGIKVINTKEGLSLAVSFGEEDEVFRGL